MPSVTGWIGRGLARWVRVVLRFRKLVIVAVLAAAVLAVGYASTRLGIDTDTADMISAELPWRRDFIEFRESFAARDRNIAIVVTALSAERADAYSSALIERLMERPDLFGSIFAAGAGEFFERNGLLYLSIEQLETLADRLAAAQPLIGLLKPAFDGAAVVEVVGRTLDVEGGSGADDPAAAALYRELSSTFTAAALGARDPVEWRQLTMGGEASAGAQAGERRIVVLRPVLDFDRVQPAAPAMAGLRAIVDELGAAEFPDVTARLTGTVAMEHEEMLSVRSGAGLAALASLMMVAVVLYATLRSFKLIAIALVTLVVGLIGTAAFAAAAVGHLNLLSVAFAVLYVGLGVDFIIHICLRLKELLAAGRGIDDSIVETARGVGTSLVICAVTTAAGFYAFIPTEFEGVAELGLISGTGMFVSLVVSFTLLPALLGQFLSDADARPRAAWLPARGLAPLASRPRIVVAATVVVVAVTFSLLPRAEFDSNPIHLRDPQSESVRALEELAMDSEAPLFDIVAVAPDHDTALAWAESLRELPVVRSVTTVEALVPGRQDEKLFILQDISLIMGPGFADLERVAPDPERLERALVSLLDDLRARPGQDGAVAELEHALAALLGRLEAAGEPERQRLLTALDADVAGGLPGELARLEKGLAAQPFERVSLPSALAERWIGPRGGELIEVAPRENVNDNEAARRFVEGVRSVVPSATGLPVVYQEASRTVVRSFERALAYALILVTALLFVFLRSFRDVVLVIVPIVLAVGVTAGLTVLLGIPMNFANVITLPLLVGVGVDNGIHIVHRMRSEPPPDGGPFATSTSLAVLASGLTTVASFGNLGFSAHRGMASMGQLLTIGMIVMLAATLILLPALLRIRSGR